MKINEDSKEGKCTSSDILQLFPRLRLQRSLSVDRKCLEGPDIPPIFLQQDFDISKPDTFYTVFPFAKDDKPGGSSFQQNGKLLQEKVRGLTIQPLKHCFKIIYIILYYLS